MSLPATAPALPDRKPREAEMDAHGVTHAGRVRKDNQDHFILCSLRKHVVLGRGMPRESEAPAGV